MDKSSVVNFSAILLLMFVISISEITKVNGVLCERKSLTYSRLVCHNHRCDHRCIGWEKAVHGTCHFHDWFLTCYCYYDTCTDAPPVPPLPPPPPGSGGPPGGGGSGKDGGGKGKGGGKDGGGGGTEKPCI